MSNVRRNISPLWQFFKKIGSAEGFKATCNLCSRELSYRSSTGNLNSHLRAIHGASYTKLSKIIKAQTPRKSDADEDSNSSTKYSAEIWSNFETEGEVARCAHCRHETSNTVEDMRGHLEEEHPGLMIGILNKNTNNHEKDDNDSSDDEREVDPIEEEVFTDVLYLEEDKPRPSKRSRRSRTADKKPTRTLEQTTEPQTQKIEYTVIENPSESRPEIEAFLTYISVLLKNVPKESIPKLQLDIISSILNAQMAKNTAVPVTSVIPISNTVTIPVTSDNMITNGGIFRTENAKYHITIDNGLIQKSPRHP